MPRWPHRTPRSRPKSLGLSCVYIGALRNNPQEVARIVGLPPGAFGVFGMCVGYASAAGATEVKPRLPQDVVMHRETYDTSGETGRRAAYDAVLESILRAAGNGDRHLDQAGDRPDGQDRRHGRTRQAGRDPATRWASN